MFGAISIIKEVDKNVEITKGRSSESTGEKNKYRERKAISFKKECWIGLIKRLFKILSLKFQNQLWRRSIIFHEIAPTAPTI